MVFKSAWILARKDTVAFFRDRTALFLTLLVPIALVTVFGWIMAYAFGGSGGMPRVELEVADLCDSKASQRFVKRLKSLDSLKVRKVELVAAAAKVGSVAQAADPMERLQKRIRDGEAHHVLIIPASFDEDLAGDRAPQLQMLRDPGRQMEEQMIQIGLMQAIIPEFGEKIWFQVVENMLLDEGMSSDDVKSIKSWISSIGGTIDAFVATQQAAEGLLGNSKATDNEDAGSRPETEAATAEAATAENSDDEPLEGGIDPNELFRVMERVLPVTMTDIQPPNRSVQVTYQQAQSVAGMTVMMLLFALTSCGSVLLVERESGMLRRLFSQPIPRNGILLGKYLFACIIGAMQMLVLFIYGELMFKVGLFRDPVTLFMLSATWIATGAAFGIFLAAFCKTSKQSESLASLLVLVMAALGGCWFPLQLMNLPIALETVCKSTMTYWAMTGFQSMLWNQLPWYSSKVLTALAFQWGWAISLSLLAVYFFRRNYCRG